MRKLREAPDNYILIRAGCARPSITFFSFAQVAQSSRQTSSRSRRPREVPDTSPLSRAGCASIQQRHASVPLGTETRQKSSAPRARILLIYSYLGGGVARFPAAARAAVRSIAGVKMSRCMMHLSILNCQLSLVLVREFAVEHLVDDEHSVRHADCAVVVYVATNLAYLPTI